MTGQSVRDRLKRELVLDYWRSGRRSTEEIARDMGMAEEDVCRILERAETARKGKA